LDAPCSATTEDASNRSTAQRDLFESMIYKL
jgi:hypothetical protein